MDADIADELLNELFSTFETIDTQSAAILQFLKDKGMANDAQLAPYLEQAANASNVRARAVRLRINSLLSSAAKKAEESLVQRAEEAARKVVAAELEAEKPRRRRRTGPTGKHAQDQADRAEGKLAARSTADSQQGANSPAEQPETAQGGSAQTKPEPNKPESA
jgi:hypothetical protein